MIFRTKPLVRKGWVRDNTEYGSSYRPCPDGTYWGEVEVKDSAEDWLCHYMLQKVWDLEKAKKIQLCISAKIVKGAVVVLDSEEQGMPCWYYIRVPEFFGTSDISILSTVELKLREIAPNQTKVWAWIDILE